MNGDAIRSGGLAPAVACAAVIAWAWLGVEADPAPLADVGPAVGLGLAPALAALLLRSRLGPVRSALVGAAVLVACALPAASLAFGIPLGEMRPGDEHDFFGPLLAAAGDGFRDVYETDPGFVRADHPELASLVLVAVYGFVGICGTLIAAGLPLAAGLVLVVGVGGPATIATAADGSSPLWTGTVLLAALLLLLFLARSRTRPARALGPAAAVGGVVALVALAASTSPAVAKDAFLPWQTWDLYDEPTDPVGVRYVWASNYRGITFPDRATEVLRIQAPDRALYWRATTLDEYTGIGWRESLEPGPPVSGGRELGGIELDPTLPRAAVDPDEWVRQDVTVVALADNHLIAAAHPVRWRVGAEHEVQYAPGGVVFQPAGLEQGQTYTVWSYAPEVEPKELASLPARYPAELARYLEVVPDVRLPRFGAAGRDATVARLFEERSDDVLLSRYEPVYRLARDLVGDAASPYVAAATLETWLRGEGDFVYEEQPEQPLDSTPPLVDFLLRTREGYCQQYAGAMALMLRLLGVPARVAAGFTSGRYDEEAGEWSVNDHNAHTWVEVWFPRYGWLPFDPTPGRGELGAAYSTSSSDFPAAGGAEAIGAVPGTLPTILQRLLGIEGAGPVAPGAGATRAGTSGSDGGGIGLPGLVALALVGAVAAALGAKELRRRLRFLSRSPRSVAAACRRDVLAFLADQGHVFSASATLAEVGAFVEQRYRVNAVPFVRAVGAARFASPAVSAEAAVRARRELAQVRRQLRRALPGARRVRGALSVRSLTV